MNAPVTITAHSTEAVVGEDPQILAEIYDEPTKLAVWRRSLSSELIAEAERLLGSKAFTARRFTLPGSGEGIAEALPKLAAYPLLLADLALLTDMVSCLFSPSSIGVRFTPLTKGMCPRFHIDRVPCRLITTYVGTGTEWLPNELVDRTKLGAMSEWKSDTESGLYKDAESIRALKTGDVGLFKGEEWDGNEGRAVVHRSPSVDTATPRLLLTMDFI